MEQKNRPSGVPLNVALSVYSFKFSSPLISNLSFSIMRLVAMPVESIVSSYGRGMTMKWFLGGAAHMNRQPSYS